MSNTFDITGNLGADARINTGDFGMVANFRIGYTPRKKSGNDWIDAGPTLWFDVSAWGDLAERYGNDLLKGARVRVIGRPGSREHDGKVYTTIRAELIDIEKKAGTSTTGYVASGADPWDDTAPGPDTPPSDPWASAPAEPGW